MFIQRIKLLKQNISGPSKVQPVCLRRDVNIDCVILDCVGRFDSFAHPIFRPTEILTKYI